MKKISGKVLVPIGLIAIVLATFLYNFGNQESVVILGIMFVSFPLGLILFGMGIAQIFLEPTTTFLELDGLSIDNPVRIPDFNSKNANFILIFPIIISILLVFLPDQGIDIFLYILIFLCLLLIISMKSRKYLVYPDRLVLKIKFPANVSQEILFSDIDYIGKTRQVPISFEIFTYKVKYVSVVQSVKSEMIGVMSKDYMGAGILIKTKNNGMYVLPRCLYPDDTVKKLKELILIKTGNTIK